MGFHLTFRVRLLMSNLGHGVRKLRCDTGVFYTQLTSDEKHPLQTQMMAVLLLQLKPAVAV